MIHAINKHGQERYFRERVWNLMPKSKNGWREFDATGEIIVPQQIVEFQQSRKEAVVVEEEKSKPKSSIITKKIMDDIIPPKPKKSKVKSTNGGRR